MDDLPKRGGKRVGAGRPNRLGPTVVKAVRLPVPAVLAVERKGENLSAVLRSLLAQAGYGATSVPALRDLIRNVPAVRTQPTEPAFTEPVFVPDDY